MDFLQVRDKLEVWFMDWMVDLSKLLQEINLHVKFIPFYWATASLNSEWIKMAPQYMYFFKVYLKKFQIFSTNSHDST